MTRITRVEIITDTGGREYVSWEDDNDITVSYQDDGKTLKVFVNTVKSKSPVEEAYQKVYGWYPPTTSSVSNYEDNRWSAFQNGYNASQVIETPQEPEELKTLYQMFYDEGWTKSGCDEFCDIVKNWLPTERVENKYDANYNSGWNDLLDTLRRTLR